MALFLAVTTLAALAPETSLERVYTQTIVREEARQTGVSTSTGESLMAAGTTKLFFGGVAPGEAEIVAATGSGWIDARMDVTFTGLAPTVYEYFRAFGYASCGSGCSWGPIDFLDDQYGTGGLPVAAGETVHLSEQIFIPTGFSVDASDSQVWPFVANELSYVNRLSVNADWSSQLPVQVSSFSPPRGA